MQGSVRSTIEIKYGDEVRDLKVTFGLIDRIRAQVPWEQIAIELSKSPPSPNFAMMAKFVYLNLVEAGFDNVDIDEIYDEMMIDENQVGYIALVSQIMMAYQPRGKKKKPAPSMTLKSATGV